MATAKSKTAPTTTSVTRKKPTLKSKTSVLTPTTPVGTSITVAKKTSTALTPKQPKSMALVKPAKRSTDLVSQYQTHKNDTGSTTVQIATISEQIKQLQTHLKLHPKDHDSRRGLLIMVGKRRRLLNYLGRSDRITYQKLIVDLKLRK